ncbi:MAG: protein translocase subunit SecF [Chloroflexota bacterium]
MLNIVASRRWYFLASGVFVLLSLILLFVPPGLKWGIEFTSGSTLTVSFDKRVDQGELRSALAGLGHGEAIVQYSPSGNFFLIRLGEIEEEEKSRIETALRDRFGGLHMGFHKVSSIVAGEVRRNAAIAVAAAVAGILLYIAWAFRHMPNLWRWGACAVATLVHDVVLLLGAFALLGRLFNIQADALFITAALAVVGYGVNNVVVVFDRIRENLKRGISKDFEGVVNRSLVDTLGRQLNTTFTTLLAVLAVFLLGGATIHNFMLALLIGVVVGAYSSLLIASPLLVAWERRWPTRR